MLPAHLKNNFPFKFKNVPLLIVLLVPFALLTALAVGSAGYLSFRNGQQAVNEATIQLQREIAIQIERELETFLETPHLLNQINANAIQDELINPGDSAALERYFWQQLQLFESVSSIYFGNPQGGLVDAGREGAGGLLYIAATDSFAAGPFRKYAADERGNRADLLTTIPDFDARIHPWYARAVASGQSAWSDIYILATGQDLALAVSRPVYDAHGELLGVVSSDIFLSHLNAFLQNLTADKSREIFIIERSSGLLVAASTGESLLTTAEKGQPPQRFLAAASNVPLIQQGAAQLAAQFGNMESIENWQNFVFELNDRRYLAQVFPFYQKPNLDWLVVVLIPEADFMTPLQANSRSTVWLTVAALAAVLTASIITARRVSQALVNLNQATKLLAGGAWTQPLRFYRIKEINELSQSFNAMAVQLNQSKERMAAEIAERRQAEEKIVASEQRFRALIENSADAIVLLNVTGDIVYQSPSGLRLTGYSAEERIGRSGFDLIHPDDLDNARRLFAGLIQEPSADVSIQLRSRCKDGSWRWLEVTGANLLADPSVQAVVVNYRDITEGKQAEKSLQDLSLAVNASGDIVFMTDKEGLITSINAQFTALYGYNQEEVVGKVTPRILKSGRQSQEVYEQFWETILRGELFRGEVINKSKDGRFIFIEETVSPFLDDRGRIAGFLAIQRNITERKQLEARLLQAQKMEAIGRLAGGIAHDFNNILLPIIGYAELSLLKLPPDDELYADLTRIRKAADRAAGLVRQILAFSRQQVLEMRVLGLNAVILDFSEMIRRLIGEDIELEIFLEPALYQVKADKGQLEQVLLNLVINARDAMPTGGKLTIETANVYLEEEYVKKHAGLQIPGHFAMLSVSDTGHGMDAATKERIFEPFFTTKAESKGTGLGLATVFGIIQQHGGSIWVYSEPGHGATFKIYLPQAKDAAQRPVTVATEKPVSMGGTETILVVEDEEMVRQLVCETLAAHGYKVIEAQSPSEAVQLATEYKETIHLLLTDVIMPGMNGKALYHQVAAIYPSIKVLYMSGYTDNAIVHHGVLDEGVNFLQKPFTVNNLAQKVRSVLRASGHRGVKLP